VAVVVERAPARTNKQHTVNGSALAPDPVERLISAGFLLAAIAVAAQTVAHLTNAFFLDYGVWNMDAGVDGNALSWASSVATFSVAVGALLLGLFSRKIAWSLIAMAVVLAFFSVDDVVAIHEKLAFGDFYGVDVSDVTRRALWPLLYLPLLAFVVLSLWRLAKRSRDRVRRTIQLGLSLLAVALVAEATATVWWSKDDTARPFYDDLEIALEEGAELAGWILIATAVLGLVADRLVRTGKSIERTRIEGR
jgi:hypothetical protein